jgi:hypothetical protein
MSDFPCIRPVGLSGVIVTFAGAMSGAANRAAPRHHPAPRCDFAASPFRRHTPWNGKHAAITALPRQVVPLVRDPKDIADLLSYQLLSGVASVRYDPRQD